MMKNLLGKGIALGIVALLFVGCNENEDPLDPGAQVPQGILSPAATSVNSTTVRIRWDYPATPVPAPTGFRVTVLKDNQPVRTLQEPASARISTISNLENGTVYSFQVQAITADTASEIRSIQWAPAARAEGTYRIYETSSSNGSGLRLGATPQTLTIANGGQWDIALENRDEPVDLYFGSAGAVGYTDAAGRFPNGQVARETRMGKIIEDVNSLDEVFESEALSVPDEEGIVRFDRNSKPFAVVFRTQEGNFTKVLVKAVDGKIVQGSGTNEFIEVEVSFQEAANVPFARLVEQIGVGRTEKTELRGGITYIPGRRVQK